MIVVFFIGCVDFVPARTKVDGVFSTGDFEPLVPCVISWSHYRITQLSFKLSQLFFFFSFSIGFVDLYQS